jgi:cytochrome c oxidase subunit 2
MVSPVLVAQPQTAATFNFLYNWYLFFGIGAAIVVIGLLVVFSLRYRASGTKGPVQHKAEGWKLALVTVVLSLSILTAAEYQTFASFGNIEIPDPPGGTVQIHVLAYQWGWNFTYPNGKFTLNNLTGPTGDTVILNITSRDVFHSFGISSLAVKEDAVPGRVNQLWFQAPLPGFYKDAIRCFELCGIGHATMIGNLVVLNQTTWDSLYSASG